MEGYGKLSDNAEETQFILKPQINVNLFLSFKGYALETFNC